MIAADFCRFILVPIFLQSTGTKFIIRKRGFSVQKVRRRATQKKTKKERETETETESRMKEGCVKRNEGAKAREKKRVSN